MIKTVVVIGAGTMGHGIVTLCAQAKYSVYMVDVNENILKNAMSKIEWSLNKLKEKGALAENVNDILNRIKASTSLKDAAKDADLVIEAAPEIEDLKMNIFRELDDTVRENCILATNTSSIPISIISRSLKHGKNVIGLHFFNPPTLIKLVEIIATDKTDFNIIKDSETFVKSLNMRHINVKKDVPGFIVNRINLRIFEEVFRMAESFNHYDIDAMARFRIGLPMGFFELFDFIGLDVLNSVITELKQHGFEIQEPRLLKEKIEAGKLGVKSGEGFYKHKGTYERIEFSKENIYKINPLSVLAPGINEAAWLIENKVASKEDIELGLIMGMGYPKGLLVYADEYGIDSVSETLKNQGIEINSLLLKMVSDNKIGLRSSEGFYKWNYKKIEFKTVKYEKHHDRAFVLLNRPQKLNSFNEDLWKDLTDSIKEADQDDEVKCIIVTGEGSAFSAGDDISVMKSWKSAEDSEKFFNEYASVTVSKLVNSSKITIALVNGHAYGGGLELLLLFDLVLASDSAILSLPEIKIGAMPPIATTFGYANFGRRILRYIFTSEPIPLNLAKELGIIDDVVPKDQLYLAGTELANIIAKVPLTSIQAAKRAINSVKKHYTKIMNTGIEELIVLSDTYNFKEGMRAFLEKRAPNWK